MQISFQIFTECITFGISITNFISFATAIPDFTSVATYIAASFYLIVNVFSVDNSRVKIMSFVTCKHGFYFSVTASIKDFTSVPTHLKEFILVNTPITDFTLIYYYRFPL